MDENTTSWRNHGFTLMIFGGIVVLSSIFFVLGMLVGRNQGQKAAEVAYAEEESRKPGVETGSEDFPLTYYNQSTQEKPDLTLQPLPPPPAAPAQPPATAKNIPQPPASDPKTDKKSESNSASTSSKKAPQPQEKVVESKQPAPKPTSGGTSYLQVASVSTEKQGTAELKKVQSKGFKATLKQVKVNGKTMYRVLVGPLKDSELKSTQSNLQAKGYRDVIPR